jgi:hypothetical protein
VHRAGKMEVPSFGGQRPPPLKKGINRSFAAGDAAQATESLCGGSCSQRQCSVMKNEISGQGENQ